jgi:hypothetical protein
VRAGAEHRWLIDVPVARRAGMARESGASVTRESGRQRFLGCLVRSVATVFAHPLSMQQSTDKAAGEATEPTAASPMLAICVALNLTGT